MSYRIEISRVVRKQLEKIQKSDRLEIEKEILKLSENPRPHAVKKMKGEENVYRIRVGDYRVMYEIFDHVLRVIVIKVAHRREVYR
ncbi:MAG: type II toxin-antitoxin system RelE/ParE family toxin [Deltaproteobacteria bacterium]|nr:type II toxin-antitoxin system RelE/ParE family toxin [Deltaproteobacteria bacterium]